MRPVGYSVMAVLFSGQACFWPCLMLPSGIDSFQMVSGSQVQTETLNQLLQDMQDCGPGRIP